MSELSEKQWAMLCHISALAGYIFPVGNILAPLLVWSMKKDQSPVIDEHGKESINFQISVTIYAIICLVLILLFVGVLLIAALCIFQLVVVIIATIKADSGELYRYPLTIRFIK